MCSEECPHTPTTYLSTPSFSRSRKDSFSNVEKILRRKEHLSMTSSCDRFIPNRNFLDTEMSNFLLRMQKRNIVAEPRNENYSTPQQLQLQNSRNNDGNPTFERFHDNGMFYAWSEKPERMKNYRMRLIDSVVGSCHGDLKVLKLTSPRTNIHVSPSQHKEHSQKIKRFIPRFPESILDIPMITHVYGSNVIDWCSSTNHIAVAIETTVCIYHPITKRSFKVPLKANQNGEPIYDVTAVAWNASGSLLAITMENSDLLIWNMSNNLTIQINLARCNGTATSLAWRCARLEEYEILYLALDCECIWQFSIQSFSDVKVEEICGNLKFIPSMLKLSSNDKYLCCCGHTGELAIIDVDVDCSVMKRMQAHDGIVKALAWCPWKHNMAATGGCSTKDHFIKIWNVNTGSKIVEVDAGASVYSLVWSEVHKELISGHGDDNDYVLIWKYPDMELQFRLVGHKSKIFYLGFGLDKSLLASIGQDDILMFWRCFDGYDNDANVVKQSVVRSRFELTTLHCTIR